MRRACATSADCARRWAGCAEGPVPPTRAPASAGAARRLPDPPGWLPGPPGWLPGPPGWLPEPARLGELDVAAGRVDDHTLVGHLHALDLQVHRQGGDADGEVLE